MTEEEAKTKWCPMVRTGLVAGMAVNHHAGSRLDAPPQGDVHDETRCVASDCMMWRVLPIVNVLTNTNGYCGLAGSVLVEPIVPLYEAATIQEKPHRKQVAKSD
jgi:hypothetical protein